MSTTPPAGLRPALFLALALTLAACDASDSAPPVEAGFQADVRGAFSRTVQGAAAVDPLAGAAVVADLGIEAHGQTLTALRLGESEADDTFTIVGTTAGPLVPGTYPIRNAAESPVEPAPSRFVVLYRYDGPEGGVALSTSGTLTITAVTADGIDGSFAFDAQVLDADVKDPASEPDLAVSGAFQAETLDRPARADG
ncbi:hypothetical protein RQM47_06915 [Rubrivirga sp. S365]|uniref:Lipoprotein n=1 Tax=Rubrivirga litoralis TaxID=3075598 RepID=A0ABU3BSN0_9BACT|nr:MULTISPECIES: hypothetical protein [unclassified Rubrivirga]MDT0632240.1 hypothetical protein [Rubrivirga sp. F394]MDT7856366.1 hypothetical protein [Rubrivirga sp. S365]